MIRPKLIVTIDTEGDNQWDYIHRKEVTLENIKKIPLLDKIFERYAVKPTYLVTYPVATDKESASLLKDILGPGRCEIGAHFHPWSTPPVRETDLKNTTPPHHLDTAQLKEKLRTLTIAIEDNFKIKPVSYRAGRWGIDKRTIGILEELGYCIDSSVTPLVSWRKVAGPDFIRAPRMPYRLDYDNLCIPGKSNMIEVPVSIGFSKNTPEPIRRYYVSGTGPGILYALLRRLGIFKILWLRPSVSSLRRMKELADILTEEAAPVFVMMFHSSDTVIGGNPNYKSAEHVRGFFYRLEAILDYLKNKKALDSLLLKEYRMD